MAELMRKLPKRGLKSLVRAISKQDGETCDTDGCDGEAVFATVWFDMHRVTYGESTFCGPCTSSVLNSMASTMEQLSAERFFTNHDDARKDIEVA